MFKDDSTEYEQEILVKPEVGLFKNIFIVHYFIYVSIWIRVFITYIDVILQKVYHLQIWYFSKIQAS